MESAPAIMSRLRWWFSAKNLVALALVVVMIAVSLKTRGPQVHGHICFFAAETCEAAAHARRVQPDSGDDAAAAAAAAAAVAAAAEREAEAHVCAMRDLLKLIACKSGKFDDACCKGYRHFLRANCVCAYEAWPRHYVGDDMTPMIWAQNVMQCNVSYAQVAYSSPCLQQPSRTCPEDATDGDVSLSAHPRGLLLLRRDGEWGRVRGIGLSQPIADSSCQALGYARAKSFTSSSAVAATYETMPNDQGDGDDDPIGETDEESGADLALGVPARVHLLQCDDNDEDLDRCSRLADNRPLGGMSLGWSGRRLRAGRAGRAAPARGRRAQDDHDEDDAALAAADAEAGTDPDRRLTHAERVERRHADAAEAEAEAEAEGTRRSRRQEEERKAEAAEAGADAPGADAGADAPGDGAWVLECTRALPDDPEGAKLPGPQACWQSREDTTDCSGEVTSASVACGTAGAVEES